MEDNDGRKAKSEETSYFETGILDGDWDNAQWIYYDGGAAERQSAVLPAETDTHYTISYDLKMDSSYSGIMWGMDTNCYGEYYLWAFDTREDEVWLVTSKMKYEDTLIESRLSLAELGISKESFIQSAHDIRIEVDGKYVDTYLDGAMISKEEMDEAKAMGLLGFWTGRGAYYAYYDNIRVETDGGDVLYREDFSDENGNIFSPFYTKIEDGWLEASPGVITVPGGEEPAPMFRKEFQTDDGKKIESARLYICSLGTYEAYLNGEEITKEYFAAGNSYYAEEVYYRTYDVTEFVRDGDNVFGAVLGHGRYDRAKSNWGEELALCAKFVVRYDDKSEQTFVTDDTWAAYGNGPVRRDDLFWGEYYDARYEIGDWTVFGYNCEGWSSASLLESDATAVRKRAFEGAPVMCLEERLPVAVTQPQEGCFVYDFGQNFSGICRICVHGNEGQAVTVRYAEALNEENMLCRDDDVGKIWTQNLCTAKNTDYYIMKGNGREIFEPEFVCRGFRYVQITGIDEALTGDDIKALVLSSQNARTGSFECSEDKINTLYNNIYWTQLSNFVDMPTDCPQRDERLGWSGDAQVFAPAAAYNSNIYNFMSRYLEALRLGQNDDGSIQDIGLLPAVSGGSNGWGDAIITITWTLYRQYGDERIIEDNFEAMCRYMDYLVATSDNYIRYDEGFGDHNAVSGAEIALSNTAQCAHVADLLSRMCKVLGNMKAYEKYAEVYQNYRHAWQDNYINDDGSIGYWIPSEYVLGLAFGLYPKELEAAGAEKLNISLEAGDFHISTGYITTPYILSVLCRYGYVGSAYKLITQEGYPSWNYMFAHGGTTITESWMTYYEADDGKYGINGSLNHYALGSVAEWIYSDLLGIKADVSSAGFKHFILQPMGINQIGEVSGSYESMYGTIKSCRRIENGETVYTFVIPPNTSATVILPEDNGESMELEAGTYIFKR